jgi:PAS domain S-box-containing protein
MKHRILYLDDNLESLLLVEEILNDKYTVYCTSSVAEAFDILENEKIAVVISDYSMPEIDGLEFLSKVKEIYPHISSILLTAFSNIDLAIKAFKEVAVVEILTKPINFDKLEAILHGAFKEVLQKKKIEKKRKKQEGIQKLLRDAFFHSPIIQLLVDSKGVVKLINKKASDFVGKPITANQLIGSVLNCINSLSRNGCGANLECLHCDLRNAFEHTFRTGLPVVNKEGTMSFIFNESKQDFDFLITTNILSPVDEQLVQISIVDITEYKNQSKALKISENRYRLLFEHLNSGFALHEFCTDNIGKNYRFLEINPAFEEITNLKKQNIIGKTVKEVIPNIEKSWLDRYEKVALHGESIRFEDYNSLINKYFEVCAYSPESNLFATVITDISERKILEQTLKFTSIQTIFPKYTTFCEETVLFLSSLLAVDFVMITSCIPEKNREKIIAYSEYGKIKTNYAFEPKVSPFELLEKQRQIVNVSDFKNIYPETDILKNFQIESFAGNVLSNSKNEIIGHIAVFHEKRLINPEIVKKVLALIAVKVSFEIEMHEYLAEKELLTEDLQKMIKARNKEIELRIKTEKEMLSAVLSAEEKERSHFAREMHDGIGPQLSIVNMYLNVLLNSDKNDEKTEILKKAISLLEGSVHSLVEISHAMSPNILQKNGLSYAIESFCKKIEHENSPKFSLKLVSEIRCRHEIEFSLYRICTELINNSLKYSQSKIIKILLDFPSNHIQFIFSDNGIGFNYEETVAYPKGMGLENIKNRVIALGGTFNFFSQSGKGVSCNILIPITETE